MLSLDHILLLDSWKVFHLITGCGFVQHSWNQIVHIFAFWTSNFRKIKLIVSLGWKNTARIVLYQRVEESRKERKMEGKKVWGKWRANIKVECLMEVKTSGNSSWERGSQSGEGGGPTSLIRWTKAERAGLNPKSHSRCNTWKPKI